MLRRFALYELPVKRVPHLHSLAVAFYATSTNETNSYILIAYDRRVLPVGPPCPQVKKLKCKRIVQGKDVGGGVGYDDFA